jgi:hypothetical protein
MHLISVAVDPIPMLGAFARLHLNMRHLTPGTWEVARAESPAWMCSDAGTETMHLPSILDLGKEWLAV